VSVTAVKGEPTLQVGGNRAEAAGYQPIVSFNGDAKVVAASAAGSADLHQLPKAT